VKQRLYFLTRNQGILALLGFSVALYLLPGRFAYPVTGRVVSATANVASFFSPAPPEDRAVPAVDQLRNELSIATSELSAARNEIYLLQRELESVGAVKSSSAARLTNVIPARVVMRREASNFRRTALVNRGSAHGVAPDMPVLWGFKHEDGRLSACVVGVVEAVGPNASRVLLASDPGFRIAGRMLESRSRVIVEGKAAAAAPMRLKHVPEDARVKVGDAVLTSGRLGMFPQGVLIGTVAKIEGSRYAGGLEISVVSPVDLDDLESVVIVQMEEPEVQGDDR
jgi:rod shape-determining protein MreC